MAYGVRGERFFQTDTYQDFIPEHDPDAVEPDRQQIVAWRDEQLAKTPLKREANWAPSSAESVASQIAALKIREHKEPSVAGCPKPRHISNRNIRAAPRQGCCMKRLLGVLMLVFVSTVAPRHAGGQSSPAEIAIRCRRPCRR